MKPFFGSNYLATTKKSLFIIDDHNPQKSVYDECVTHLGWFINQWSKAVTIDQLPCHITNNSKQIISIGVHDFTKLMISEKNHYYIKQFVPLEIIDIDKFPFWLSERYQIKAIDINPICMKFVKNPSVEFVIKMLKKNPSISKYVSSKLMESVDEYMKIMDYCDFNEKIDLYT